MSKETDSAHPSSDIIGSWGRELSDKRIILCVAGSVAAYRAIDMARLLMRHGASVTCVASHAALRLIHKDYLQWATGNEVVTDLTGKMEHIQLADRGRSDAILVYPATANTLGKLACGIDDTPISTVLTTALGAAIPIVLCPAMHQVMYENEAVKRNMEFLEEKVTIIPPDMIEGKAKAPEPSHVLDHMMGILGRNGPLAGKKVLVTAGPTTEYIDPVRVITNLSSGKTGVHIARCLVCAGAQVTLIYGPGSASPPASVTLVRVTTSQEMADELYRRLEAGPDIVVMAAAVADYTPKKRSDKKIKKMDSLPLEKVPKIIGHIKDIREDVLLVGFKAEAGASAEELIKAAREQIAETGADLVVANDVGARRYLQDPSSNEVVIVSSDSAVSSGWIPKEAIARIIVREIERRIAK